jgi:hypothetical protein
MDQFNSNFSNDLPPSPERPTFLKVLCILTFVNCGIMILIYLLGSLALGISGERAEELMGNMTQNYPQLQMQFPVENASEFFHQIGMICLICLFANIASLVGAIMMWNLNKIGFFIYVIAELSTNFIGMNMNASAEGGKSYGGLIFTIVIDLIFIIMYAVNLKYMNGKKSVPTT